MNQAWDDEEADGATGYIVCRACGTRIRANREACLRCGEPLEATPETVSFSTISSGRPLIATLGVVLTVAVLLAVVWIYRPSIENDSSMSSARSAPSSAPRVAGSSSLRDSSPARLPSTSGCLDASAAGPDLASVDLQSVRATYEGVVEKNPRNADALNSLGRVLEQLGDRAGAATRFQQAAALSPDTWAYRFNFGRSLCEQSLWDGAVREFRAAESALKFNAVTAFNLAYALHQAGNDNAAVLEYQAAIRLAPEEGVFHRALAESLERTGQKDAAGEEFERYLQLQPEAPDGASIRARLEALGGPGTPPH